jgi:excinuclease ABC subunit C
MDFIVTNSEVEALLLEDSLIKKHKPKYNIDLKDSKSYAFIELTDEEFPRLIIKRNDLRKKSEKEGKLFGPFVSADSRNHALHILNKTFRLRTCRKLPKKKCLRFDLGICSGPCIGEISKTDYQKDVNSALMVLKGKDKELIEKLEKNMKTASKKMDYEKAMRLREQKRSVEYLREKQNVERQKKFNEDILNFVVKNNLVYIMVFNIYQGTLLNKQEFTFDYKEDFLEEFISRFYSSNEIPKEILVPKKVSDSLEKYLSKKKGSKVILRVPQKGDLKELMDLVKKNIELTFKLF